MKRYSILILIASFVLASVFVVACGQKAPHSRDDVLASFCGIARSQTLPSQLSQDFLRYWSTETILGKVKYIEKTLYEVEFPNMEHSGVEVWRIDMENSKIWPTNSGSLLSAIVLFCKDRNDKTGD